MDQASLASLIWCIPALPLAGFLVLGLISVLSARSKVAPAQGIVAALAVVGPALACVLTLVAATQITHVSTAGGVSCPGWVWFELAGRPLGIGLLFDRLSALMLAFITGIGAAIVLYSTAYMKEDRGYARFLAYLNLFLFNMIVLVLGDSLLLTFLGWEGVGLCSYLLIGFWHKDHANNDAARKAFIVNRVGDLGFLLGCICLLAAMGESASLHYLDIRAFFGSDAAAAAPGLLIAASLLLFLGATGKSAQFPLLTWLPDAMAGPTPVSALIHAATMVTAGVFLLARMEPLFDATSADTAIWIGGIAGATALWAAIAGLVQWDIKKALAYSTISQLGYMFLACAVGAYDAALFHVFTHAFFKAALFLGAGSVITALHHEQDMRRMGGLKKLLPHTHGAMLLAWYSLIGLPLGAAFFSKDLILEKLQHAGHHDGWAFGLWILGLVTAGITAIYMTRMMCYVFWSPARFRADPVHPVREPSPVMVTVVAVLAIAGLCSGMLWIPFLKYGNGSPFANWLNPQGAMAALSPTDYDAAVASAATGGAVSEGFLDRLVSSVDTHALGWAGVSTLIAMVCAAAAWYRFRRGPTLVEPLAPLQGVAAGWTWWLDRLYDAVLVKPLVLLGHGIALLIDYPLVAGVGRGAGSVLGFFGSGFQGFQRSQLRVSLLLSVIALVVVLSMVAMELMNVPVNVPVAAPSIPTEAAP